MICKPQRKSPSFPNVVWWWCFPWEHQSPLRWRLGSFLLEWRHPVFSGGLPGCGDTPQAVQGTLVSCLIWRGREISVNTVWEEEWNGQRMRLRNGCVKHQVEEGQGAWEQHSNTHLSNSWWEKELTCQGRQAVQSIRTLVAMRVTGPWPLWHSSWVHGLLSLTLGPRCGMKGSCCLWLPFWALPQRSPGPILSPGPIKIILLSAPRALPAPGKV